jgi:hypothetical protein
MTLTRKDAGATLLTALVVLVFLATHESWNVWLIGDSRRWAAVAISLLGVTTCALGTPAKDATSKFLMVLGIAAFILAVLSIATGSLTALSLLVTTIVVLWALSTARHAQYIGAGWPVPH